MTSYVTSCMLKLCNHVKIVKVLAESVEQNSGMTKVELNLTVH